MNIMNKNREFTITDLTEDIIEDARIQLNETDEIRAKAIEELRSLIKKEKNLVVPLNDELLIAFLRCRKWKIDQAFIVFKNFWKMRRKYKYIFDNVGPVEKVREILLRNFVGIFHYRDNTNSAVILLKMGKWDTKFASFEELAVTVIAIYLFLLKYPVQQIYGFRAIIDFRGMSWSHMKLLTPWNLRFVVNGIQFSFPARFKGLHFIHSSKAVECINKVIHPLLTTKLKERLMFHNDFEELKQYIPTEILPREYGGDVDSFNNNRWIHLFDDYTDELLEILTYGYKN